LRSNLFLTQEQMAISDKVAELIGATTDLCGFWIMRLNRIRREFSACFLSRRHFGTVVLDGTRVSFSLFLLRNVSHPSSSREHSSLWNSGEKFSSCPNDWSLWNMLKQPIPIFYVVEKKKKKEFLLIVLSLLFFACKIFFFFVLMAESVWGLWKPNWSLERVAAGLLTNGLMMGLDPPPIVPVVIVSKSPALWSYTVLSRTCER
jgi:hypothetical protein